MEDVKDVVTVRHPLEGTLVQRSTQDVVRSQSRHSLAAVGVNLPVEVEFSHPPPYPIRIVRTGRTLEVIVEEQPPTTC